MPSLMKHYIGHAHITCWAVLFSVLNILGCAKEGNESTSNYTIGTEPLEEAGIPVHLREIENLTVYPASKNPAYEIRLSREMSLGDSEEVVIGRSASIVTDHMGRVFIPDIDQLTIHVYSSEGNYLTNLGREGDGPGEFRGFQPKSIDTDSNWLYVFDSISRRVHLFSLETLSFSHTVNMGRWHTIEELRSTIPALGFVRNDGSILMIFGRIPNPNSDQTARYYYYIMDEQGEILPDKIFDHKLREPWISGGIARTMQLDTSNDDRIFAAWTEEFLVKIYSSDGDYLHAFYHPTDEVALNWNDLINHSTDERFIEAALNTPDLPQTWPIIESLIIDSEDRLWISTIVENIDVYEWWVLKETGEIISRFEWPRDRHIEVVGNGSVYTREVDDETGLTEIVRYRIEMEEV